MLFINLSPDHFHLHFLFAGFEFLQEPFACTAAQFARGADVCRLLLASLTPPPWQPHPSGIGRMTFSL